MLPLLAVALAATPVQTPTLASGTFTAVGIDPARARFFSDYFADQLNASGAVRVITRSEMEARLGVDRQRQLLGCGDDGTCLAELAGALNAGSIIMGTVAQIADETAVELKIVASDGKLLGLYSARVRGEPAVLDFLADSARQLAAQLAGPKPSRAWLAPVVGGAALLVASAVCFTLAGTTHARIVSGVPEFGQYPDLVAARRTGETANLLAFVFLAVGAAALVTGLLMQLIGARS